MKQLRKLLNHTLNVLTGVSFLAMVVMTCWQVFTRSIYYKIRLPGPRNWCPTCLRGWRYLELP